MRAATLHGAPTDATAQTQQTLTAYFDALLHGGDYGAYLADDVTLTLMDTGEVTHGRAAVVGLIEYLHRVAFAANPEFAPPVVEGGRAMLEAVFVATQIGDFAGIAATNRTVRVPYAVAYDLAADQITALRIYLSMDALVRQIRGA